MVKFRWEKEFKETPIGKIPKDWEVKKIGQISKRVTDFVANGSFAQLRRNVKYYSEENYAILVRSTDLNKEPPTFKVFIDEHAYNFLRKTKLFGGEVVIANVGHNVGDVFLVPRLNKPMSLGPNLILFESTGVDRYFYYFFKSRQGRELVLTLVGGSGQPKFNKTEFKELHVCVPPIDEQKRIATVLSWFDDLIENKRRQNEILEKMAMAIFKSWFIDFEPFQDEEFVYSEELDMEIPKGWEVKPLKELVSTIQSGKGKHYMIRAQKQGHSLDTGEGYPLWGANGILGYVQEYDIDGWVILTGRVGTLGKVFISYGKIALSDNILAIHPYAKDAVFFEYLWFKSMVDFDSLNVGSTQPLIRKGDLERLPIIKPPKPILEKFHSLVEPLFRKIIINEKEIMVLKKARDTLLPQLVFGRLRVEEI